MTDYHRRHGDDDPQQYGSGSPPPPPYAPARPVGGEPGVAVRPGGHGGEPPGADAPAGPAGHRRRARRPVALVAAVAVAAAVLGGGAGALAQRLAAGERVTPTGASPVTGTNVSASGKSTVAGVAEAVSPSIVEIRADGGEGQSTGSGVVITADGEIVTNNHVVSGASRIQVRLSDGTAYTADVLGTDPDKDLALIKLRGAEGLKAATLGDSDALRVGDEVVAIGSPEGLTGTVTSGIVSALDRDVTVPRDGEDGGSRQGWPFEFGGQQFNGDTGSSTTTYQAIQTDASLNPGNSGGALIDMNGEIIGINSAMYSPAGADSGSTAGSVGLGFAIPVDTVKADLDRLRSGD
ncbi:trypsin-like peptidase domain-containing protein [Streptomyces sp. MUM 203J]|uniref:S1C family serine protease n=1 Tax=Streptomyces sp. MUM 203J TaxID=2791990 RepID=UPI001F0500B0|nr:trypsin-like peptidase domain-containing protein [Streptomyces sp. MUM 203J]MCH0538552.1 trypsin-like peptidase domain-containing protein [Streptomyces sp. MUM 203J]